MEDASCDFRLVSREPLGELEERLVVEVDALATGCGPCAADLMLSAGSETRAIPLRAVAARSPVLAQEPEISLGYGPPEVLRTANFSFQKRLGTCGPLPG